MKYVITRETSEATKAQRREMQRTRAALGKERVRAKLEAHRANPKYAEALELLGRLRMSARWHDLAREVGSSRTLLRWLQHQHIPHTVDLEAFCASANRLLD